MALSQAQHGSIHARHQPSTHIMLRQACYNISDAMPLPSRAETMLHTAIGKTAEALATVDFCARRVPFDIPHPTWRKYWLHDNKDCSFRMMKAFTIFLPVWIDRNGYQQAPPSQVPQYAHYAPRSSDSRTLIAMPQSNSQTSPNIPQHIYIFRLR